MNLVLINSAGLLLIGFIIYWFWFAKPRTVKTTSKEIEIIVDDGIYSPSHIQVGVGESITLRFLRKDPSPCAEKVVFSSLNISEDLPINKHKDVTITIDQAGEYEFTCQMQMYRGTLLVQ